RLGNGRLDILGPGAERRPGRTHKEVADLRDGPRAHDVAATGCLDAGAARTAATGSTSPAHATCPGGSLAVAAARRCHGRARNRSLENESHTRTSQGFKPPDHDSGTCLSRQVTNTSLHCATGHHVRWYRVNES